MPRFLKHFSVVHAATFVALALSLWSSSRLVAQEQPQPQDPIKQRIFVPWGDIETLIDRDRRGVLLPNADFQKLFETARKHAGENPQVDAGYAVTRVDYVGRLADDQLLLTATVEFTVFTPGWKAIPLGWKGLSVERATLGEQAAQLGRSGDAERPLYLLENRPGKRTLTVELSRTLDSAGSDKFASFGLTSAPTGTFEITLPAEKHLQFDGLPIDRTAAHDQPAKYQLPIGGRKTLSLRITDRPTQQTSEGLVFATSAMALRVEPEEVTWQDITRLQVYGKPLDQLSFTIPTELALVSVTSPGLEKWEFAASEDDPEKTILKLSYRQPFQEARTVNIAGVLPVKARKWTAPTLKLANATAHTAILVVSRPAGLRLRLDEAVGASRAGADGAQIPQPLAAQDGLPALQAPTLPGASGSDVKTTYQAWREDFTLSFTTEEKARELQAAISTLLNINAQGLDLHSSIGVQTRFAPLFEIGLTLPADWNVVEIRKDGQTVAWQSVPEKAGVHELRIPFDPPLPVGQAATITLVAHRDLENWPVEEGSVSFALPEVQLLQADVVEGTYQVLAEKDLQVVANQVRGLDPANAAVPAGQEIPRLSYEYQDTHFAGELSISRKPSRIAAISLAYVRLDRETLSSHLEALLHVEGGGIRRLDLSLPESAGNDLRFQLVDSPVQIVEQTAAAPANGRRVWTLQFDQRVTGALRVVVDVETKRGDAREFSPPLLTIPAAERESSRIAVEAATDQELEITAVGANGEPLIEMDPADLPAPRLYFPHERIVAAYTGTAPGAKITLRETRFERDAVPTAICESLQIESVLGETGEFQHRATYTFRAVGVQNLLATLPETGLLWAAVVNGQPVEVRKAEAGYLIPLPHVADVAAPRTLQLFYRTEVGRMAAAGRLQQSPPRVSAVNGEGQEQPMDVLEQHWTVHHPGETEFIASRAQFQPDAPLAEAGFLGSLQRSFGVDTPANLGWKLLGLVIVFAILGFTWMGHRRFGIRGFASAMLLVFMFGLGAIAFFTFASRGNMSGEYFSDASKYPAPTSAAPTPVAGFGEAAPARSDDEMSLSRKAIGHEFSEMPAEAKKDAANAEHLIGSYGKALLYSDAPPQSALDGNAPSAESGLSLESQNEATTRPESGKPQNAPPDPFLGTRQRNEVLQGQNGQGRFQDALRAPQAPPIKAEIAAMDDAQAMPKPAAQPNAPAGAAARPQPPVDGPGPGVIPARGRFGAPAAGGLMSLSLHLEPPPGGRTTNLTYTGVAAAEAPQMDLRYENRRQLSYITLFVEMVVVIVFWWLRRASVSTRLGLAACGLCLPIGLAPTAPLALLPYLDGILFGTLAGLVLWLVAGAIHGWRTYCVRRPIWAAPSATLLIALAVGLCGNTAQAGDKSPGQEEPQPQKQSQHSDPQPQVAPRTDVPFGGRHALIVPYEEGTDPLKAEKIYLPYDRFVELWNQAHPDRLLQGSAPVEGLVDEALYAVEVVPFKEGQPARANVTARIVLTSFRKDQIQLPLPLGRVAFQSAQLDGKSAALITPPEADKPLEVAVTGAGTHVLDLKFAVAVERIGPAGRLTLPLKPVASGLLRFVLPAADLTVRVNGGGAFRRTKLGDDQLVLIPVDQGGDIAIAWQPAQTRAAVEGTIHAEIAQALVIDDAGVRLAASSIFRVRQGSLSEALFALPAPLAVRRISGPDVGGWEIEGEGDKRTLRVFLRRKVEDETTLNFDLYLGRKLEDVATSVTLPAFAPLGVTRETGAVGVFASSEFSVHAGIISGLNQIDVKNFPLQRLTPPPTGLPQIAWHYSSRPIQLEIQVKRRIPQLRATVDHQAFVESRKIAIHSRFDLSLSGAPRSEIAIRLPKDFLVDVVQSPVLSDWYVTGREAGADGPQNPILHVEFTEPRTGSLELTLDGKLTRDPDKIVVPLEFPQPLGVDEMVSTTAVALDSAFQGQIAAHPTWRSVDPAQLNPMQCGNLGRPAQFAFHSSQPQPEGLALEVTRAKPSLNANVLAMVAIDDDGVHDTFAFKWDISLAGADTFTFTAPAVLNGRLEFPELGGPRIRNVSQNDAGNGRTRWTLTLEQPLQNRYFLVATAVLPLPADGMVRAPNFVFEQAAAQGAYELLAVQGEYVLLANRSQFQVAPQAREGIESIPADDLQHVMKVRPDLIDQAAEIVRIRDPRAVVAWKLQRMKAEKLLPAVINLSNQITVLAADGSWRAQATYRIRNRSRQFLALQMPEGSRILSLFVRNLPARPVHTTRNGRNLELIPLPKTIEGDLSFDVTLVFSGRLPDGALPKGFHVARRTLDIPSPHVLQQSEDAEFGMPTAQTTWTVYLPASLDVEVLTDSGRTNVNYVTEAEQQMEQTTAFLNDLSELVNVNSSTSNRRAKAQSLNNLKQLGTTLHNYHNNPRQSGLNPQDQQRQQELDRRAEKLAKTITDLETKNAAEGLLIQSDALGNTVVFDTKSRSNEQQAAQSLWAANNDVGGAQPQDTNGKPSVSTADAANQNPGQNYRQQLKSKAQSQSGMLNSEVQQQKDSLAQQRAGGGSNDYSFDGQPTQRPIDSNAMFPNGAGVTYPRQYAGNGGQPAGDNVPPGFSKNAEQFQSGMTRNFAMGGQSAVTQHWHDSNGPEGADREVPILNKIPYNKKYKGGAAGMGGPQSVGGGQQGLGGGNQGFGGATGSGPGGFGGAMGGGLAAGGGGAVQLRQPANPVMAIAASPADARDLAANPNLGEQPPAWTAVGGLSLLIDIPKTGQKLTFAKVTGDARLGLGVRPHETLEKGIGLLWTIAWLALLGGAFWLMWHPERRARVLRVLPVSLAILGGLIFLLLPGQSILGWLAFWLFLIATAVAFFSRSRVRTA